MNTALRVGSTEHVPPVVLGKVDPLPFSAHWSIQVSCAGGSSPSGALWLLGLALPRFLFCAARFAPSSSVTTVSLECHVQLWVAGTPSLNE